MNNLKIFENSQFGKIRTLVKDDEPWFVGKDVTAALGYTKLDAMYHVIDDIDKQKINPQSIENTGFPQNGGDRLESNPNIKVLMLINESSLYQATFNSTLPTAKQFKRWVTSEVLSAICKHGGYLTSEKTKELLKNPDLLIQMLTDLKAERAKRAEAEQQLKAAEPKVIFADAVSASDATILIGDLAKLIKQNGHAIGQKRLFQWLRENGFLIKRQGADYNSPTQYAMELRLFKIKETAITHSDGHVTVSKTVKVTGKGQQYFINKFTEIEGGVEK